MRHRKPESGWGRWGRAHHVSLSGRVNDEEAIDGRQEDMGCLPSMPSVHQTPGFDSQHCTNRACATQSLCLGVLVLCKSKQEGDSLKLYPWLGSNLRPCLGHPAMAAGRDVQDTCTDGGYSLAASSPDSPTTSLPSRVTHGFTEMQLHGLQCQRNL